MYCCILLLPFFTNNQLKYGIMNLQYKTANHNVLYPIKEENNSDNLFSDFMTVPFNKGHHIIRFDEILFLRSESSYTLIYLESGKKILSSRTLKSYDTALPAHLFMRIHRSYIIPMKRVQTIYNNPSAVLINNEQLPVSKNYKPLLKTYFF